MYHIIMIQRGGETFYVLICNHVVVNVTSCCITGVVPYVCIALHTLGTRQDIDSNYIYGRDRFLIIRGLALALQNSSATLHS